MDQRVKFLARLLDGEARHDFLGHRHERHNAHISAVRAVQRRHQLQRVERVLAQHEAWRRMGVDPEGAAETVNALNEMHEELVAEMLAEMLAEGQQP